MKPRDKRILLRELIQLFIYFDYDFTEFLGRSLNYFDYEKIKLKIEELENEKKTENEF